MAKVDVEQIDAAVQRLNPKIPLPQQAYSVRCNDETFGLSKSSGNPMITREWEICSPAVIDVGGKKVEIAGTKVKQYITTQVNANKDTTEEEAKAKTIQNQKRWLDERRLLGLSVEDLDSENPPLDAKGVVATAVLGNQESIMANPPTPEQLAEGKKVGDPIRDAEGSVMKNYYAKFVALVGLSSEEVNNAY